MSVIVYVLVALTLGNAVEGFLDWKTLWKQYNGNSVQQSGDISTNGCSIQVLKGLEGTIESPGFPNHYSNNLNCKWTILVPEKYRAIHLEFIKFSVENPRWSRTCFRDYVDIFHFPNDEKERKVRICGKKHGKLLLVNGKKLEFHFKTNFLRTRRGFQIKWKAVEGCGGLLSNDQGVLQLPAIEKNNKNYFCEWTVKPNVETKKIIIKIDKLIADNSYASCHKIQLTVYDNKRRQIEKFCQQDKLNIIHIDNSEVHLLLKIAKITGEQEFNVTWTAVPTRSDINNNYDQTQCGLVKKPTNRVRRLVGGARASNYDWPWIVQVKVAEMTRKFRIRQVICGGSIISSSFILTAAHCVVRRNQVLRLEILIGATSEYSLEKRVIEIPYKNVISHENYKWSHRTAPENDIALLKSPQRLVPADNVKVVCLPVIGNYSLIDEKDCEFAGWGKEENENTYSRYLNTVTAQSWGNCGKSKSVLCVTYQNRKGGACRGDSGSPLICNGKDGRKYVRGVLSYGARTCPSFVDGHSDVYYYTEWIKMKLKSSDEIGNWWGK